MNFIKNSFSKFILLIIAGWFIYQFSSKIEKVAKNEATCVCAYDGFGYYMYLPALVNNGSLNMQRDWAQNLQDSYCSQDLFVYQLIPLENGKFIDVYHMGLALVQLPSYLIGDQIASFTGHKRDGFSKPYHIANILNALFFILIGLIYLRKLLRLFFDERITGTVILILYLTSNILTTFIESYQLTHLFIFTFNAIFLYHLFKFKDSNLKKHLLFSALIFGLSCFVRPTQAIWGIIPFILFWKKYGFNFKLFFFLSWYPIAAIILNIPHVLYWLFIGDQYLMLNLHTEDLVLSDPNIWKFLFSYKKGWLLYTPIFLFLIPGFIALYRQNKNIFWAFLSLLLINIYILCTWECWWYAASYSSRVMVDSYPLLAIILGFVLLSIRSRNNNTRINKVLKIGISFIVIACIGLNIIQMIQLNKNYLHLDRMSKEHYWYIFGRTEIPDYTNNRLEIDRGNVDWNTNPFYKKNPHFEIYNKTILAINHPLDVQSNIFIKIGEINLSKQLTTDETMFDYSIICRSSDSTISSQIRMEQSSIYNVYSWQTIELSKDLPQNKWNEIHIRFNEASLRHEGDLYQLYTFTDGNATVEIKSIKVVAHSLVRK